MSVIAVRKTQSEITIAADSLMVSGHLKHQTSGIKFSKIIASNGVTIGTAGDASELVLMEIFCTDNHPKSEDREGVLQFIVDFQNWAKEKQDDFAAENSYIFVFSSGAFLVPVPLEVYEINEFEAIGSGGEHAKVAMRLGLNPVEACKIACEFCIYCAEPIISYSV